MRETKADVLLRGEELLPTDFVVILRACSACRGTGIQRDQSTAIERCASCEGHRHDLFKMTIEDLFSQYEVMQSPLMKAMKVEESLQLFLEAECEFEDDYWTFNMEFYTAYVRWCSRNGFSSTLSSTNIGRRLTGIGCQSRVRRFKGKVSRGWSGLRLKSHSRS